MLRSKSTNGSDKKYTRFPAIKGCSCKRSQCIKNYCDCYQSLIPCTSMCKCVSCRNTEERSMATIPPPKTPSLSKRERAAAALRSNAEDEAANAGSNIHLIKVPPDSTTFSRTEFEEQVQQVGVEPSQLPAKQLNPVQDVAASIKSEKSDEPSLDPSDTNIFQSDLNAAIVDCLVIPAQEAEELQLKEDQVAKVVLSEFQNLLGEIITAYFK